MIRKAVGWAVFVFLIYFIATKTGAAITLAHHLGNLASRLGTAAADILSSL